MENSKKTPLQLLEQTCKGIGMSDPPSKSKSILPLTETTKPSKPNVDLKPRIEKDDGKNDKLSFSPSGNGSCDFPEGHKSPKSDIAKVPMIGQPSTVGQALPPTLPPTGVAPKCGGCITPYPGSILGSYPLVPQSSSAGLYNPGGLPGPPPGAYSASLHAAAAAAAASLPPFFPPCREPYCRVCPPGGNLPMGSNAAHMNGGRCPFGCFHCTPSAHDLYLLSAATHPLFSSGFPGIPTPTGLGGPPVSLAPFSFNSLYNPSALAAMAGATSPQAPTAAPVPPVATTVATSATFSCSWGTGDTPCGKRFANSDELREHLNTHVQQQDGTKSPSQPAAPATTSAPGPTAPSSPQARTPPTVVSVAPPSTTPGIVAPIPAPTIVAAPPVSCSSAPPPIPMPSPLGRPYSPRSMLAAASLSSLNHRYHPYGKVPISLPSSLPGPLSHMAGFPGTLNPAALGYPLGGLYGQRLPGSLPHP